MGTESNEGFIMSQEEYYKWYIYLLEMEVAALRSVLTEFEGDKLEYTQMIKADSIDQLKNSLVHP